MQAPPIQPGGDRLQGVEPPPPDLGEIRSPRQIKWARRRRSFSRFWKQFRTNRMGMVGLAILVFFIGMAVFAMFADPAATDPSLTQNPSNHPPSLEYPFGTEWLGLSVLSLVIQGSTASLAVGLAATVMTMTIGAAVGVIAGYRGGATDTVLMRFTDFGLVIPWLALAIVLATILGPSTITIIVVIGVTSWPATARLVRSQVLSVRERPYVERSRALGASDSHMIIHHVLPNVTPVILANTVLTVAIAILSESALSFLGLGNPLTPTWGGILEQAYTQGALTSGEWWWITAPGMCIVLVTLAFTMVGFAMDEILNPKLRER